MTPVISMKKYIFNGGNSKNRFRGLICTIGWKLETSDHYIVYFSEDAPYPQMEIVSLSDLIEVTPDDN